MADLEVENGIESTRSPIAGNFRLLRGAFVKFYDPQVENETDQPDRRFVEVDSEDEHLQLNNKL